MTALIIGQPRLERAAGRLRYSSQIRLPGVEFEMWFRGPEEALSPQGADAFLAACLTTAMHLGLPMIVEGGVSPRLLAATPQIQDIFRCWDKSLKRIEIHATHRATRRTTLNPPQTRTASFFSGGVDSFYSALKHTQDIDALILVHGFDIPLSNIELRGKASRNVGLAAQFLGKPLIEIETNSRELTDRYVSWIYHQFGPALGAVALLLGGVAERVVIPASESYANLDPCGSHPLLDPWWSTEEIEIIHDGAEASRNDKVALIAQHLSLLPMLRVCWENRDNSYNCGRCEKCIRTMIHLEAAGALANCPAFDTPLDATIVANMHIPNELVSYHVEENLRLLRKNQRNPTLIAALERSINRYRSENIAKQILDVELKSLPMLGKSVAAELMRRARRKLQRLLRKNSA